MKKMTLFLLIFTTILSIISFGSDNGAVLKTDYPKGIKNITAITESTGLGEKVTTVILEMNGIINNSKLTNDVFTVEGREINKIYASSKNEKNSKAENGKYIVIELSNKDSEATSRTRDFTGNATKVNLVQNKDIVLTNKKIYKASANRILTNNSVKRLVIEDFEQFEFKDEKTGITLKYNLYIPKNYGTTGNKKYPLVLFMHDAGPLSENTETTLIQGNGATSWAKPEIQQKYESFVLAPQYPVKVVNDDHEATAHLEATKNLLDYLTKKYNIDTNRLYTTGQSMGGMMSLALNSKYPDLFAASYYVACQWDPAVMASVSKNKAWIVVSTGDTKAYPGMNAITKVFEENGGVVVRDENWDGASTSAQFTELVNKTIAKNPNANVYYTTIKEGTIPYRPAGNKGAEHVYTWTVAYNIDAIKDWIFAQSK